MHTQVTRTVDGDGGFCVLRRLRTIRRSVPDLWLCLPISGCVAGTQPIGFRQRDVRGPASSSVSQSVLNATARLLYRRRRFDHVTPRLHDLHWLKAPERVAYKLAVTVYRCLHGMAPPYLCDGLQVPFFLLAFFSVVTSNLTQDLLTLLYVL